MATKRVTFIVDIDVPTDNTNRDYIWEAKEILRVAPYYNDHSVEATVTDVDVDLPDQTIPAATQSAAYTAHAILATKGVAPYTFDVQDFIDPADIIPDGMSLSASGVLSGTPTTPGTYTPRIRVTDANGDYVVTQYTITVNGA